MEFAAIHDGVQGGLVFFEDSEAAGTAVGKLCEEAGGHDAGIV